WGLRLVGWRRMTRKSTSVGMWSERGRPGTRRGSTATTHGPTGKFRTPAGACDHRRMDTELSARTAALAEAVHEVERHVAAQGWDAPIAVYSLVRSSDLVATSPEMA